MPKNSGETEGRAGSLVQRMREANTGGALHIVVDDGNLDDHSIKFCLGLDDITSEEAELARALLDLSEDEREALWEEAYP